MRRDLLAFTGFAAMMCAGASALAEPPKKAPPPRLPLPDVRSAPTLPWRRHVELGGDIAYVNRLAVHSAGSPNIHYEPTVGFGLHAGIEIFRYLRWAAHFVDARHDLSLPPGSLGLHEASEIETPSVYTFVFGARFMPTLPLGSRVRLWATVGVGYGRFEFDRMQVTEPGHGQYTVRDRSDPFIEFPLGGGASFEIIPGWLLVKVELTGAFVDNQEGDAVGPVQAIDGMGRKREVGGFPEISGSFVQTLGLSLAL